MKTSCIAIFFAFLSTLAFADRDDLLKKQEATIASLVEESRKTIPDCEKFKNAASNLDKDFYASNMSRPLPSKEAVRSLVQLIQDYPSSVDTNAKLTQALEDLKQYPNADEADLSQLLRSNGCALIALYDAEKAVLTSMKDYHFTNAEKKEVLSVLLIRLDAETKNSRALISSLVSLATLNQMIDTKLLDVSDAIFVMLAQIEDQAEEVKQELRDERASSNLGNKTTDLSSSERRKFNKLIFDEITKTRPIQRKINRIVKRIEMQNKIDTDL